MSRFYEALREASRSPAQPTDKSEEAESDLLGLVNGSVPSIQMPTVPEQEVSGFGAEKESRELKPESPHRDLLGTTKVPLNGSALQHDGVSRNGSVQPELYDPVSVNPEIRFDPKARLITQAPDTVVVEHYRRLRTKILQQHAEKPFKSLLVASPNPQEGKTVTVLNLGLSFAMMPNFKVLVVDGDLRRGTIGKLLGVDDRPGLSDLMEGKRELSDVVLRCPDLPVQFVLRGTSKLPAAELLHSPNVSGLFRRMTEQFDLVLVDSSPVNLITDAQLLAGNCDAVLLVARAFSTTRKSLEQTAQELKAFRMIGTVLNGGTQAQLYRRYNGYY